MIRNAGDRGCKYLVFCAIINLKNMEVFLQKYSSEAGSSLQAVQRKKG